MSKTSTDQRETEGKSLELALNPLLGVRLAVLSVVTILAASTTLTAPYLEAGYTNKLYGPIAALYAFTGASLVCLMLRKAGTTFRLLQAVADITIITGIVYLTGSIVSPFLFLYLPLVMAAAILYSREEALSVALGAIAAYSLLIWGLKIGVISPVDDISGLYLPQKNASVQILGLFSAMILVAIATSFLTRKARSAGMLVVKSRIDIEELTARQKALIDELSEGVITTKADHTILSINQAAAALLGISADLSVGRSLLDLLRPISADLRLHSSSSKEFSVPREVEINIGGAITTIAYFGTILANDHGEPTLIYIFRDVTKLKSAEDQLAMQEQMARLLASSDDGELRSSEGLHEFIGESQVLKKVFSLIERVAPSEATVLISGESGTGKELVARAIHQKGARASGPFVAVNCGAIPSELMESEFFGHKKGAFTGAISDSSGFFRQADGGTVFLDEIGELPLSMQSKLLRVLQERIVRPVGGENEHPINVRVIAATNRHLRKEVERGTFREDLYYRLNVISLTLPPLRDRKEDIPLLVRGFLKRALPNNKVPVVPPATMQLLMNHAYPGNVRELENILERAVVLGGEVILPEHLPEYLRELREGQSTEQRQGSETTIHEVEGLEFPVNLDALLGDIERKYLLIALERTNGVRKKAAELLGMNFRSFRYRLQKFGIHDE